MPVARPSVKAARRSVALVLMAALVALGAACGAVAPRTGQTGGGQTSSGQTPGGGGVPARDRFQGSVSSATGTFAGHTGRARVYLRPLGGGATRSVTITFAGLPCAGASRCLDLSGTARGALAPGPGHTPDVGHGYVLSAVGSIRPLGRTRVIGGVHGTGFIAHGQEMLTLTLTTGSGSVTIEARSAPVRGFTSP